MAFSLVGPFLGYLLCLGVCFLYPASLSFQLLLDEKAAPSATLRSDHVQHVVFWIICAWICFAESISPFAILAQYIPFYYEVKCLLFYWLAAPRFKGAGWLWLHAISPAYEKAAPICAQMYDERCPPQVKVALQKGRAAVIGGAKAGQEADEDAFSKSRQPSKAANASKAD